MKRFESSLYFRANSLEIKWNQTLYSLISKRNSQEKVKLAYALRNMNHLFITTPNVIEMNKTLSLILFMLLANVAIGQPIGHVDKRTKEFYIVSDLKMDYRVFGYQFASNATPKMICFSSHAGDVAANYNNCPLGSYYDTGKLKLGDRIVYLGSYGSFGKMSFISGSGKKTIFYLPKSSFTIK